MTGWTPRNRRMVFLATALAAVLAVPMAAEAARGTGSAGPDEILHNPRLLARYLRLDAAQTATLRTLFDQLQATIRPLAAQQKELRRELSEALAAANPNACSIGELQIEIHELGERIHAAFEAFDDAFSAILTREQLVRYEALKEAARRFGIKEEGD